ncbi:MAG: PIG-L deacetylase family protein [Candidatus Omnitrophota bacterium]
MNVLGVGAHYDDLELGCSGTLIKHVRNGDNVTMLVITDSAYNNMDGESVRSKEVAYDEGLRASEIIGARLLCLNYNTFLVPFDETLTKKIGHLIETLKIDTIYSHWLHDLHRDHQYTAKSTLMAGRHVQRFLMYRSNYYGTETMFNGNFYSDISDHMEKKIEVIKAHRSEMERVRYKWLEFFKNQNANDGQIIGVDYAESFQIIRYLV